MRKNQPHRVKERRLGALERTNKSLAMYEGMTDKSERYLLSESRQRIMAERLKLKLKKKEEV